MISWQTASKIGCGTSCLVIAVFLIFVGPGGILGLALFAGSQRTIFERSTSPDGSYEARVQFDDCGAPCGFARVVYVRSAWFDLDSPRWSCRAFVGDGIAPVSLSWSDDRTLVIAHGFALSDVGDVVAACDGVRIIVATPESTVAAES